MRISDWSSDVCSSDLNGAATPRGVALRLDMPELKSEFICAMFATLQAPPEVIPVPHGIRVNFYITGGTLDGPRLKGKLRPVGADFFTLRHDGVGELDVRTTIETADGALIYTHYVGIGDMGVEGHARFLAGEIGRAHV